MPTHEVYQSDGKGNTVLVSVDVLVPPAPTPEAIRAEAQRRIMVLCGASDLNACITKQLNAQMRDAELTKTIAAGGTLTQAEQAEAAALAALAAGIKSIRARSNAIEAAPPEDWTDDARWV